jgi:hypothetical protein
MNVVRNQVGVLRVLVGVEEDVRVSVVERTVGLRHGLDLELLDSPNQEARDTFDALPCGLKNNVRSYDEVKKIFTSP